MNDVRVFGRRAQASAARYAAAQLPLLIVSADAAVPAIQEAVRMRSAGVRFECALVLDEPREGQARMLGAAILRGIADFDTRRNAFELLDREQWALNGIAQRDVGRLNEPVALTLHDLAALSDGFAVQSWKELRKLHNLLRVHRPGRLTVSLDESIPRIAPDANADAVLVWAPENTPDEIAPVLFALEELRRPSYVVCRPGPMFGLKTLPVLRELCEKALSRARVVIDASVDSPAFALSFAAQGFRTVATSACAAGEFAPAMHTYDLRSRRSAFRAVLAALGSPAPAVSLPDGRKPPAQAVATVPERGPLVSIIVRTYKRAPEFLRRALQGIEAQTYANTEAVVVNDGGDERAVAAAVADFSRARFITVPHGGVALAGTAGVRAARGKYAGFCDDDDFLFPDHVERLAGALERSGALSAHANAINAYFNPAGKNWALRGYRAIVVPGLEPTTMLSICQVVGSARMLFHRAWVEASGPFEPSIVPADDYEMWLRLIAADDVAAVDGITWMYSQFANAENDSVALGANYFGAHRKIYEMHPCGRPAVAARREAVLEALEKAKGLGMFPPVVTFDPQPLLFEA